MFMFRTFFSQRKSPNPLRERQRDFAKKESVGLYRWIAQVRFLVLELLVKDIQPPQT